MNPRSAAVQIVRPPTNSTSDGPAPVTSNAGAAIFVPAGQQHTAGANAGQVGSGSGKKGASSHQNMTSHEEQETKWW